MASYQVSFGVSILCCNHFRTANAAHFVGTTKGI